MSTSTNYPGQNVLISYLKKQGSNSSYYGFLNLHYNIIVTSTFSDDWKSLDNAWTTHFLEEAEKLNLNQKVLKEKINAEHFRYTDNLQTFWQRIIKEHKKENILSTATTVTLHPKAIKISVKKLPNSKASQQDFHKKAQKNTEIQVKQKEELKRIRDNDDTEIEHWKKQSQILKQNKNNLAYKQAVDNALLIASAYESLIADNIKPFIKILKTSLLTRSRMSLSSANESVLQAIVENLLPSKYYIPELSLVMNGKKPKAQKNNFGSANELEDLGKILEKENEESVLKRPYSYWSKEDKKTNQTTIGEILNNGMNQLNSYMKTISKGRVMNYSSSGVFDECVKITKSKPNKLKGFVILVIGFHRILWRSAEEVTTNYIYNKV